MKTMGRALLAGLAAALAAHSAAAQAPSDSPPSPRPPTFATGVDLVRLDVFASRDGRPLAGLAAEDFEVLDNGVPQRAEIESAGGPVHAILLLDTSGSVAGHRLDHLRAAARAFVDGLGPRDQATLLTFSHAVRLASAPSLDRAPLRRALDEARAGGGTALHDALFAALQFADPSLGRGVVLVFSDGDDRLSWLDARQLRDAVRRSEASIYAVALASDADAGGSGSVAYLPDTSRGQGRTVAPGRHGDAPNRELLPSNVFRPASASPRTELPPLLRDLAVDTGGRVWQAEGGPQLQAAFLQALAEAKSRYLLRFAPSAAPGWHSLEVRLRARKGEVRARKGYVAAAP